MAEAVSANGRRRQHRTAFRHYLNPPCLREHRRARCPPRSPELRWLARGTGRGSGDPRADFLNLLRVVQATFEREHHVMRALQLEVARHPDIGVALSRDFIAQRLDVLIGVLRRAAGAGLLRASSDLELLARLG